MNGSFSSDWPSPAARRRLALALLALTTLFAAAVRLHQAGESLWLDELHTAWTVSEGPPQLVSRAAMGNQGALFFFLTWAITEVFGSSEFALRAPSLVAGIALVPSLYFALAYWSGSRSAALLAALLAAIDPSFVFYAQEARPYACVQLVSLAHVLIFGRLLAGPCASLRCGFVVGGALLFYLHYTAALLGAAELLCYVLLRIAAPGRLAYRLRDFLFDGTVLCLLLVPAWPHLREIAARRDNWSLFIGVWPSPAMQHMVRAYVAIPLAAAAVLGVLRWIIQWRPSWVAVDARVALLVGCWFATPTAIAWLATYTEIAALFHLRYLISSAVASIVIAGLCCASRPARLERALLAVVVVAAAFWQSGVITQFRRDGRLMAARHENWRDAVAWLNAPERDTPQPVFVRSGLIEADALHERRDDAFREYCLLPVLGPYRLERPPEELIPLPTTRPLQLDEATKRAVASRGGAWLIVRGGTPTADAATRELLAELQGIGTPFRVAERRSFGNVTVVRFAHSSKPATLS